MLSLRNFEKSPAIYSISVDSRSRPAGEPVNRYHIELNANLQRVRTVQLGSIYIPAGAIQAIGDTLNNNIQYLEPISLPGPATLVLQETVKVYDANNALISTTVLPSVTITLPPTLNQIVSVTNGNPTPVQTLVNHGLTSGLVEWPKAGLNISLVGGFYPAPVGASALDYGPQLTSATVAVTGATTFNFVAGYLDSLAAAPQSARNTQAGPPAFYSYIYAEPPTLSELLMILNNQLSALNNPNNFAPAGTSLILPVYFRLSDATNSLIVEAGSYDKTIGTQRTVVTTSILSTGTINSLLGFPAGVTLTGITPSHSYSLSALPYVHQVNLVHGTYTQSELEPMVTRKLAPLDFTGLAAADRTFHWADSAGVDRALILPEGRYNGAQLATVLQSLMQTATGSANYLVTFSANGKFTFENSVNSIIGLNFLLGSNTMAFKLGFQNQNYTGFPTYTSPFPIETSFPVTAFQLYGDTITQKFTLAAQAVPTVLSNNIVALPLQWNTLTAAAGALVPGGFYPGQVVQFTMGANKPPDLVTGSVLTGVIDASWPGTTGLNPYVVLKPTASILAPNAIGQPSNLLPVYITPVRRPVYEFLFSAPQTASELLGFPKQVLPVNPSLGQVMNADEPNVYFLPSGGGTYGLGAASSFTGPFLYNLLGPDYILMRVLNDCDANTSNEHSYLLNSWNILAKMYLRPNYQHISEEMLHVAFSGMKRISALFVEFLNPDGSLVDFNGRDHTYSLLFTAEIKFATSICM
jgi:hypothetical protein